jgi:hypothetical protein
MSDGSADWQLSWATWTQLCQELEPITAADQPYERIRISRSPAGDGLTAFVEEPFPTAPTPPQEATDDDSLVPSGSWIEDAPTNETTTLPPAVAEAIWTVLNGLRSSGIAISDERIAIRYTTGLFAPQGSVAVFALERQLSPNENDLYTQFRDLMVTLGHGEDPESITHGSDLAPYEDDISSNTLDFGIGATAYRLVPDPHRYWADCDSLEEYIDMCVANGADRESLAARELYYHHFHPTTISRDLDPAEEAAVEAWHATLQSLFVPAVSFGDDVLDHYLSNAHVTEDGTGTVEYSIAVGDPLLDSE